MTFPQICVDNGWICVRRPLAGARLGCAAFLGSLKGLPELPDRPSVVPRRGRVGIAPEPQRLASGALLRFGIRRSIVQGLFLGEEFVVPGEPSLHLGQVRVV